MQVKARLTSPMVSVLILVTLFVGSSLLVSPCQADTTGTLKLMVWGCKASSWLSNASVGVVVVRPGVGQVDSDSGYTNGSGYVEFTFESLEDGDEAHVTVTASGSGPDTDHTYYWVMPEGRNEGTWDLGFLGDSLCLDDWYNQEAGIIKCAYELPESEE